MPVGSYAKSSYFGVPNKAIAYPADFDQTDAAIAKAEQSPGAKLCADKIAKARELAKKGVETYWACHTAEGLALLAEARKLAAEAEVCGPAKPREVIVLKGVNFAFNSTELTPKSKENLDQWVAKIKTDTSSRVEIAGHTDSIGSDAYNQKLSELRAKAVVDYFVTKGIAAARLKAVGYGKSKPVASNKTEEGRAQNRRVELQIF
ncbi:MAG: OmpA family protein [Desulfobacterales bacterium]|nr:OmpA family protein [Desulfobacterales bacterium]